MTPQAPTPQMAMCHRWDIQRLQTKNHNLTPCIEKQPKACVPLKYGIYLTMPHISSTEICLALSFGCMDGRIKPWWDVYIFLLTKIYKMLYTNKLNNCIFPEKISWMIILSQDLWLNSTQPGLMISASQILGKRVDYYLSSIHYVLGTTGH